MSASTQTGEANRTQPIPNGNGHKPRKPRGPNKNPRKTAAKTPAPPQGVSAQTAVPAAPAARIAPTVATIAGGAIPIAYLRQRLANLDVERNVIQSVIAAASPRTMPGAPRKAKQKRAKRKTMQKAA